MNGQNKIRGMIELSLSMYRLVLFATLLSIAFAVSNTDKAERAS